MIVIVALIAGAVIGALSARKRNGTTLDVLQYTAVYAIIFGVVGMLATILVHRIII